MPQPPLPRWHRRHCSSTPLQGSGRHTIHACPMCISLVLGRAVDFRPSRQRGSRGVKWPAGVLSFCSPCHPTLLCRIQPPFSFSVALGRRSAAQWVTAAQCGLTSCIARNLAQRALRVTNQQDTQRATNPNMKYSYVNSTCAYLLWFPWGECTGSHWVQAWQCTTRAA